MLSILSQKWFLLKLYIFEHPTHVRLYAYIPIKGYQQRANIRIYFMQEEEYEQYYKQQQWLAGNIK